MARVEKELNASSKAVAPSSNIGSKVTTKEAATDKVVVAAANDTSTPGDVKKLDASPCPQGNNTQIGSALKFNVTCQSDIGGDNIGTESVADMNACTDLCVKHHPLCDGVLFSGSTCTLKANVQAANQTHPTGTSDGAIAILPTTNSNCDKLGGISQVNNKQNTFSTYCGFTISGKDIGSNFAASFQDCMKQCVSTTGCGAVSYEASMSQGFQNCYMKVASASPKDNTADLSFDVAFLQAGVASPSSATTSNPTGSNSRPSETSSAASVSPQAAQSGSAAAVSPVSLAAIIVGSVAALVVIVVAFIVLGRKRRRGGWCWGRRGSGDSGSSKGFNESYKFPGPDSYREASMRASSPHMLSPYSTPPGRKPFGISSVITSSKKHIPIMLDPGDVGGTRYESFYGKDGGKTRLEDIREGREGR